MLHERMGKGSCAFLVGPCLLGRVQTGLASAIQAWLENSKCAPSCRPAHGRAGSIAMRFSKLAVLLLLLLAEFGEVDEAAITQFQEDCCGYGSEALWAAGCEEGRAF